MLCNTERIGSITREIGHFVDYSFNREIVKVKAHVFLAVFAKDIGSVEACMVEAAKRDYRESSTASAVLDKALSMSQRAEKFLACHSNKISVLSKALAAFTGVAPVVISK